LGASVYELGPGDEMVFHYHVQREELLIVVVATGTALTARVRVLVVSEMNGPNIGVYPDTNQVGIFDAGQRMKRRFGALFNVADAVDDYRGRAKVVPPAAGPRTERRST
jgi:uncharacterized cupin superfamily protein